MQLDQGLLKGEAVVVTQGTTPWIVSSSSTPYNVFLDEASATITYVGEAEPGTSAASALWRIKRLDSTSGLLITWADGDSDFDKVWNDRATYSYS